MTGPTKPSAPKRLSTSVKVMLITVPAVILIAVIAAVATNMSRPPQPTPVARSVEMSAADTVDDDSYVLDDAGEGAPTLVEFLDFECEACGAFYPYIEDIRKQYAGQINYVVRYFPIPGHFNSMTAAVAVEAAARQGKFEEMYQRMFDTQSEWGEKQVSEAPRFRGYAEELGLDMAAYDAAVADPATQQRVEKDFAAGQGLGVDSTPSFFLDGKKLELNTLEDLPNALDDVLGASQ